MVRTSRTVRTERQPTDAPQSGDPQDPADVPREGLKAMGEGEARLRSMLTLSNDFYWETDRQHRFVVLDPGGRFGSVDFVATRLGRTRWEVPSVLPDAAGWRAHIETLEARRSFRDFRTARRGPDGVLHHYSVDGEPVIDEAGTFRGYRGVGREITAAIRAETELRDSAAQIRALLSRLVEVQESERRKLALDLHDIVGRNLTAIGIDIEVLRGELSPEVARRLRGRFEDLATLVEEAADASRQVMLDLRPALLDDYGLDPALRSHARVIAQRTGMEVEVEGGLDAGRLRPDAELILFRIAQEALANCAKHSAASRVRIALSRAAASVRLVVEDDGRGFTPGDVEARREGIGLQAMRERAQTLGGNFRVESPGRGTRIVVEVPHADPHPAG